MGHFYPPPGSGTNPDPELKPWIVLWGIWPWIRQTPEGEPCPRQWRPPEGRSRSLSYNWEKEKELSVYKQMKILPGSVADPNPDPSHPYVFGPPGSGSISQRFGSGSRSWCHQAKIGRKNLIHTILWLLEDFKKPHPDTNPDPLVWGIDPRIEIRIHTKMSWIRNTASRVPNVKPDHWDRPDPNQTNFGSGRQTKFWIRPDPEH